MSIYNAITTTMAGVLNLLGRISPKQKPSKFFRFAKGQVGIIPHIKDTYKKTDSRPTTWVHAASLGEFAIVRPVITALKQQGYAVVMTFFSPTGYEALKDNHPGIDWLYYLPLDTHARAKAFIDIVRPTKAIFAVSEFWLNYLKQLKANNIDTYLLSAKITDRSIFNKWYGAQYRKALPTYSHIFAVDHDSVKRLQAMGAPQVSVCGNPLFDNAVEKANTPWQDPIVERFTKGRRTFIAGSIHDSNDLQLVTELANRHPDVKFLMVPHEISEKGIAALQEALHLKSIRYSQCTDDIDLQQVQSLIIDHVGALAYLYRYAQWAYVGGGFTPYLHSLIEATVYGLPVAFGPMTYRKVTHQQLIERGIGEIVHDADELNSWFWNLKEAPRRMAEIKEKAKKYVDENTGSTQLIINEILK